MPSHCQVALVRIRAPPTFKRTTKKPQGPSLRRRPKGRGKGKSGRGGRRNFHADIDDEGLDDEDENARNETREQEYDQYLAEMSSQSEDDCEEGDEGDDAEDDDDEDAIVNYQEVDDDDEDEDDEQEEDVEKMDDEAKHHYDESMAAAQVLITKAKKLRAGAEKLRGFYKRDVPSNDRKKGDQSVQE